MSEHNRNAQKPQPWNVFRIKDQVDREGEVRSEFQACGVAWPMKKGEGFSIDLHFALPEGSRLAILPRKGDNR